MSGIVGGAGSKSGVIFKPYRAFGYWGNSASSDSVSISSDSKFPATLVQDVGVGLWSNANDRFTCNMPGIYRFSGNWEISGNAGRWGAKIKISGSADTRSNISNSVHSFQKASDWDNLNLNTLVKLVAGEYVEFFSETVPSGGFFWQYANGGWEIEYLGDSNIN